MRLKPKLACILNDAENNATCILVRNHFQSFRKVVAKCANFSLIQPRLEKRILETQTKYVDEISAGDVLEVRYVPDYEQLRRSASLPVRTNTAFMDPGFCPQPVNFSSHPSAS